MRRKRPVGRKRKHSKLSVGSADAFSSPGQDCDDDIWVIESNNDGPNGTIPDTERACGLEPQDISRQEDRLEMDWIEKEVCIKCNKGGQVLVCSDSFCPLAVHEECMKCSAWFDCMGNFYCPYCSYKQASLATHKARKKAMIAKKALSAFMDNKMMDGEPKSKAVEIGQTNSNPSAAVRDIERDSTEIRLNGNGADKHSVQIDEDQREERSNPQCTAITLPSEAAKALGKSLQNKIVPSRARGYAGPDDSGHPKIAIGKKMHSGPTIGCGDSGSGACCREEVIGRQSELEVGKSTQVEIRRPEKEGEMQEQEQGHGVSSCESDSMQQDHGRENDSLRGESVVRRSEEEEEIQEQEQGNGASSCERDSMQQDHGRENDSFHGDDVAVSPHWRTLERKNINAVQSPTADRPRQSRNKLSSEPNNNVASRKKTHATKKSGENIPLMLRYLKRRRVPWTAEEEDMLKEGVRKFSTKVNKNLPWRKILEFGSDVFESTRTPADLKDKWRNMLVKNP